MELISKITNEKKDKALFNFTKQNTKMTKRFIKFLLTVFLCYSMIELSYG